MRLRLYCQVQLCIKGCGALGAKSKTCSPVGNVGANSVDCSKFCDHHRSHVTGVGVSYRCCPGGIAWVKRVEVSRVCAQPCRQSSRCGRSKMPRNGSTS